MHVRKNPLRSTIIAVLAAAAVGTLWQHVFALRLDEPGSSPSAVVFTDRNGLPLGTLLPTNREDRAPVPWAEVSPHFIAAIVAAEDHRFFDHRGVDGLAAARAIRDAALTGSLRSGASTITMQVARLRYHIPSTWHGKLREAWLALRLEAGNSKQRILAAYINDMPMGGNIRGVQAASLRYFGTPAADLDLAQATLLAAIPNDPTRLNPRRNLPALRMRQAYVLHRMALAGAISSGDENTARREPLTILPPAQSVMWAPHFLEWLAPQLDGRTAVVQTTIDRPLQDFVQTEIRVVLAQLASRNVHDAAALVVDNATGGVLAYAGSPDFAESRSGQNDGVQALRQPGSALKPFMYELALERGAIAPNTILADVPTTYAVGAGQLYQPADYSNSYAGPVRVRAALANSLNVPAVRVLSRVGVEHFLHRLRELGFLHLRHQAGYYGLGLTLGGGEVSLWELVQGYLAMARAGRMLPLRVRKDRGVESSAEVGSGNLWTLVTDMLSDSSARAASFGVGSILDLPFDAAVKTGTSSDFRDTWTVGFSSRYTVGVWVGNFNGQPMRHVSGVSGAGPLWNRIMLHLHEARDPERFRAPEGMVRRSICATTGWKPAHDCLARVEEYLYAGQLGEYERPHRVTLSREYDEWLAAQGGAARSPAQARILFPHDHDVFALNVAPAADLAVAAPQALLFTAQLAPNVPVRWTLNGAVLAVGAVSKIQWPLRTGHWHLALDGSGIHDALEFTVLRTRPVTPRGFTFLR